MLVVYLWPLLATIKTPITQKKTLKKDNQKNEDKLKVKVYLQKEDNTKKEDDST